MPERSPRALWETALGQLELQVTRPNFDTWLRHTTGLRLEHDTLVVSVPSDFAIEWLRSRMSALINRTVSQVFGRQVSVSFEVIGLHQLVPDLPSHNEHSKPPRTPPLELDGRFTFDSFIVVESNRMAYRIARQIASDTSKYNPFLLCGPPGIGKTHLLHAIAHAAVGTGRQVILLTGEAFVSRYGETVRRGHPHSFRETLSQCDLFLLDDLQFLATRAGSQEQFFHLFNTLCSSKRRVVMTSDVPPAQLLGLSAHLRSRLQAGLTIDLPLPNSSERLHILRAKSRPHARSLSDEVLQLIAEQPYASIREFEGALNRIIAFADLHSSQLTLDAAKAALSPFHSPPRPPSVDTILKTVCSHFHITQDQLRSPSRARDITYARHIAMYLLRCLSQRPLAEIGTLLGNRDHSTVLSGYRRIAQERESLATTRTDLEQLEATLKKQSSA